jgi:hypothetical protein
MSQEDPAAEFLRRLERGENTDQFLEELAKLAPKQRTNVIQALFRELRGKDNGEEPE